MPGARGAGTTDPLLQGVRRPYPTRDPVTAPPSFAISSPWERLRKMRPEDQPLVNSDQFAGGGPGRCVVTSSGGGGWSCHFRLRQRQPGGPRIPRTTMEKNVVSSAGLASRSALWWALLLSQEWLSSGSRCWGTTADPRKSSRSRWSGSWRHRLRHQTRHRLPRKFNRSRPCNQ